MLSFFSETISVDIFEFVLFASEYFPYFLATWITLILFSKHKILAVMTLPAIVLMFVSGVVLGSHFGSDYTLVGHQYDESLPSVRAAVEDYIATGRGDIHDILESGKYKPSLGWTEARYILKDLLRHTFVHSDGHNVDNIDEGYNKGNAWFEATLGESMVYTSGIYKNGNESLWEAQHYKLDYVAKAIDLQEGDHVLDIGCGWGRLAKHFAEEYGAKVTGLTLSSDQLAYGKELNKGNEKTVHLMLQNAMTHQVDNEPDLYDKITCLEMAEHVGIKRYQEFLTSVRSMMKDDGVLYFQVAGLRRFWQYEDLVWGLFMGEHVFPGADASCPLGWVSAQLERAGFEVQRTQNLGTHYSRTLSQWLDQWLEAEDSLKEKYGETAWRRWEVFLRWSVRVARQGSSTVFMITATKAGHEPARVAAQKRLIKMPGTDEPCI